MLSLSWTFRSTSRVLKASWVLPEVLTAKLFEVHDRQRFEVFLYAHGPDDESSMRRRLVAAADRFTDLREMSDLEAARMITADKIDIAVDLTGYTSYSWAEIPSHRPAPVQVSYLGFPGTMGVDFIDYIIVDPFVVPDDQQAFFTEKLVHLPECFQVNDGTRRIADRTPSRAECGLPEDGFVFCSFNNGYKITRFLRRASNKCHRGRAPANSCRSFGSKTGRCHYRCCRFDDRRSAGSRG